MFWGIGGSELRRRFDWSEIPLRWGSAENFLGIPLFWAVAVVRAHAFCDILGVFQGLEASRLRRRIAWSAMTGKWCSAVNLARDTPVLGCGSR